MPDQIAMSFERPEWSQEEMQVWRPRDRLTVSEWVERHVVLPPPAAEQGKIRLMRTPYLVPIMDRMVDPDVEEIVFCKAAQIAGTQFALSVVAYFCEQEPSPVMVVLADKDTAEYITRERFQRMVDKCPSLHKLKDKTTWTRTEMAFINGAYVCAGWATSVAVLASRPIRIVVFDEVDKPGYLLSTREADPISLGTERTETYSDRKLIKLSTPTIEVGNIWVELQDCDVIYTWHVPCPACGEYQPLVWSSERDGVEIFGGPEFRSMGGRMLPLGGVVWNGGRDATQEQITEARYKCGPCGAKWTTVEKNAAVANGIMVPIAEPRRDPPRKVGYHVSRLYSLLGRSGRLDTLVERWLRCFQDLKKLQGFVNSTLAVPWKEGVVKADHEMILARKWDLEPQIVPYDAVALTCGIDVQQYGFWFTVWAWWQNYSSALVDYGWVETWNDVGALIFDTEYTIQRDPNEKGEHDPKTMSIWRAGIDTGGTVGADGTWSKTEEVYDWLRVNSRGVIFGVKGEGPRFNQRVRHTIIERMPGPQGRKIPGGLVLWLLDVSAFKEILFWRFSSNPEAGDPQPIFLHKETDNIFAMQITAEQKERNKNGQFVWVQKRVDNHLLDSSIYAHACADRQWMGGLARFAGGTKGKKKRIERQRRAGFVRQGGNGSWVRR